MRATSDISVPGSEEIISHRMIPLQRHLPEPETVPEKVLLIVRHGSKSDGGSVTPGEPTNKAGPPVREALLYW